MTVLVSRQAGGTFPHPKRVSSLLVTDSKDAVAAMYSDLGFTQVETDDPRCTGYIAGSSGVILTTPDFAAECWGADAARAVSGQWIPYIFMERLPGPAASTAVIADCETTFGTHERIVQTPAGLAILVEMARTP